MVLQAQEFISAISGVARNFKGGIISTTFLGVFLAEQI